jgi:hypothetical protein
MFTRHQLYQLYEEGRAPTVRLIESVLDYSEELKHDPHTRQQRHIADLAERIAKRAGRSSTSHLSSRGWLSTAR